MPFLAYSWLLSPKINLPLPWGGGGGGVLGGGGGNNGFSECFLKTIYIAPPYAMEW